MDSSDSSMEIVQCPFAIRWIIHEEEVKRALKDKKGILRTKHIPLPLVFGMDYSFQFGYPNEDERQKELHLWLMLRIARDETIMANYSVSIPSAGVFDENKVTFDKENSWHNTYLCEVDEFYQKESNFMVNGEMIVKVEGTFSISKSKPLPSPQNVKMMSSVLGKQLWENEESKDFSILVDGKLKKVHKIVLITRSSVFNKMLQAGMKETMENQVEITDFTLDVIEAAIEFCYDRDSTGSLSFPQLISLLQFSDKYDIPDLKEHLEEILEKKIYVTTVCAIANGSLISNSIKLQHLSAKYLLKCMKESKPICDFDVLDKDFALEITKDSFSQLF